MSLENDLNYCRDIIKKNSKSFYKAFSKLSYEKANAVFAVYAFCRTVDDIVDISKDEYGLETLRKELLMFQKGKEVSSPMWRSLRWVFSEYTMDIKPFFQMIQGQQMDLNFKQVRTQEELNEYCYYVAGTVGLMLLPILSTKNSEELKEYAINLGKAMQLTNILRDIGEDFLNHRIYIPIEVMDKFNYTKEDLEGLIINDNFIRMWEYEALIAEKTYRDCEKKIHLYDKDCIKPILLAGKFYENILTAVRDNGYDCLTKRNYISKIKKYKIILQTILR